MKEGEVVGQNSLWHDERVPFINPPEDLQCTRSGKDGWRCSRWRIHGRTHCELHFLLQKSYHDKSKKKKIRKSSGATHPLSPSTSRSKKRKRDRTQPKQQLEEDQVTCVSEKEHGNDDQVVPWSQRTRIAKLAAEKLEIGIAPKPKTNVCLLFVFWF